MKGNYTSKLRNVKAFVQSYLRSKAGRDASRKGTAMYHAFVEAAQ